MLFQLAMTKMSIILQYLITGEIRTKKIISIKIPLVPGKEKRDLTKACKLFKFKILNYSLI